ncbi:MAG: hypothetical protein LBR52_04435 [Prevotellaceae bacterium]|jgi:tetratricopeptide (TPR) repeat protein|nr:hypothetical protein [Prevotellaceae bacterium]
MKPFLSLLISLFSACLAVFSQDDHRDHANRLFLSGKYENAIPVLKECLNLQPNDIPVQKMLAKSLFYVGYPDSTCVLYEEMAVHHPNDYDILVFLGNYYYVKANHSAKRKTVYEEKKTIFHQHRKEGGKVTSDTAIEYYYQAGKYLEKAFVLYENEEIRKSLVDIYTIVGNKDKVIQYKKNTK